MPRFMTDNNLRYLLAIVDEDFADLNEFPDELFEEDFMSFLSRRSGKTTNRTCANLHLDISENNLTRNILISKGGGVLLTLCFFWVLTVPQVAAGPGPQKTNKWKFLLKTILKNMFSHLFFSFTTL